MSYNCDKAQENISAYVDGELGIIDSIRLKLHTIKCEKCREDLSFEKDLVRTMSSENFFLPYDFSKSLHSKLEAEYNKAPAAKKKEVVFEAKTPGFASSFFTWINEKKAYVAVCACLLMFVLGFMAFQLGGSHDDVAQDDDVQTEMVYMPKGLARVADMSSISDESISSQEIAGANQNVFDKFRNKYMTKKFVANFRVVNDTVGYSTTQNRGITAIMRTIKEVVTDAVSGKTTSTATVPRVNTSLTSIAYVRPTTASSKVAVDLRARVPVSVEDESMYGVLMMDKSISGSNSTSASTEKQNSNVSVASSRDYDIREGASEKAAYMPSGNKLAFTYSDIMDYSVYTPSSLSVKNATFSMNKSDVSSVREILYEFRNSIELQETDSNILITIDSVNYEVLVSRLKMSDICTFNQAQGRDYTMSYNNLVGKQSKLMSEPNKYDELVTVTEEIEELLMKLGKNTIRINLN